MAAILDAILNLTPSAYDLRCPPIFFYSPWCPILKPRVKMKGHMIAHMTPPPTHPHPLSPRTKKLKWVCVLEESRLYRYNIRAEGTLPPSITVIARVKNIAIGFATS